MRREPWLLVTLYEKGLKLLFDDDCGQSSATSVNKRLGGHQAIGHRIGRSGSPEGIQDGEEQDRPPTVRVREEAVTSVHPDALVFPRTEKHCIR